ncbi:PP2C family serine/threonine-protein phosphatase [uncultured Thermosynechococcus sp.]|uniref:PP2C family protein-serine/threonine phosphatase n=1 Tax=uncultured Thermosynechococcus sp. TaxID=436945 RepID=UPI002608573B|nr:PP2C family serine/threonine-protein phosphatase [uncultured Thermosynechococcus sp.]
MNPTAPNLICPECGTANAIDQTECCHCRVPLLKRYLWAIGSSLDHYSVGELVGDRYLVQGKHLLLDLLPGEPAPGVDNTAQLYRPYLRLFPKRPHVPELFGALSLPEGELLLLEHAPVSCIDLADAKVAPGLTHAAPLTLIWEKANLVRRLNWLWQIISLWPALAAENVALTLLNPQLLRAEGSLVRLLQLQAGNNPTLADLGKFWQTHFSFADQGENFQQAFTILCQHMQDPQDTTPEFIRDTLETLFQQALDHLGYEYYYDIASRSDQGPSRTRNEDKCFPEGDLTNQSQVLALVCDGVGGHEGGDVAAGLAIHILKEALTPLQVLEMSPAGVEQAIQTAIRRTNDAINQRNNTEQRHERQRMGTTVVGALIEHAHLYLAHIGDSRAYWINRWGCYQLTLDDDVASRDVRLGMSTYHQALELPYGGSLVQALGMAPSQHLHPTVQHFLLDEEGILLLCSDGLSDFNRVETYWRQYLLPVLQGELSLTAAAEQLIDLANGLNGHDNVTVMLIHCRMKNAAGVIDLDYSDIVCQGELPEVTDIPMNHVAPPQPSELDIMASQMGEPPQPQPKPQPTQMSRSPAWLLLTAVGIATAALGFLTVVTSMNRSTEGVESSPSPLITPQ